jgi:energy-coupling factor transport system ATP-binding protein
VAEIDVHDLTYTYPLMQQPALRGIHLSIEKGELLAVIGANGSGKSTLCYALSGLIPHFFRGNMSGTVLIAGQDTQKCPLGALMQTIGVMLQNPASQLSGVRYTVYEEVAFGLENLGVDPSKMPERIERALGLVGLSGLEGRSPYHLSGGQQQRLALACALAMQPKALILDEPTAMLDPIGGQAIIEAIKALNQEGATVVIAENRLEWIAEFASRVVVLSQGEIVFDGSPQNILATPELPRLGVGWTRFTQAAYRARERCLWPQDKPLPVSLAQAAAGFRQVVMERKMAHGLKNDLPTDRAGFARSVVDQPTNVDVRLTDVHFTYRDGVRALLSVSLRIDAGEQIAVVGQNGSGKTTLARTLNALLRPQQGEVWVGNRCTALYTTAKLARWIAYMFQNPDEQLFQRTLWDEVAFGPRNLGYPAERIYSLVEKALAAVGLLEEKRANPRDLGFSGRKRAALACALAMDTPILALDEPTAGLDAMETEMLSNVLRQLREHRRTILVITHDIDFVAENLPRLVLLHNGHILLEGGTRNTLAATDEWMASGLHPPQMVRLGNALGLAKTYLTPEEFVDDLSARG